MKKIYPNFSETDDRFIYSANISTEFTQCMDEGLDIGAYEGLFNEAAKLPNGEAKERICDVLFDMVREAPMREDYPYDEPSDTDGICRTKKGNDGNVFVRPSDDVLAKKIRGAWYGRIAGCLLGKPVEGTRTERLIPLLKSSGNYPMHRYISVNDITDEMVEKYSFNRGTCYADVVPCAPEDDDTNYTVMSGEIIEKFGKDFTPENVAYMWLQLQSKNAYFTAERVAYINLINAYKPPYSAVYKNPFREWIGAQIRSDYYGYINPGDPAAAAEMAWRDASVSHIKNGIYGAMFVAAMLSAAACTDDIEQIITAGINEIPSGSRLYAAVAKIMEDHKNGVCEEETFAGIHKRWDEHTSYGWCHTISNAEIVTASLLYGGGDYARSVCRAVQTGFDTDCNAATVGSVIGMAKTIDAIGEEWLKPINGTLMTRIFGKDELKVDELIERTLRDCKN